MVSFLFWNLAKRPISSCLARIAAEYSVDIVIAAEVASPGVVLNDLRACANSRFELAQFEPGHKVLVFSRLPKMALSLAYGDVSRRLVVYRLSVPDAPEILLVGAHLQSKINRKSEDQLVEACELSRSIRDAEANAGHARTVLLGDLNMNPFDQGMVAAAGFHAMMTRSLAAEENRTVEGREYPFFYNPMWGYMGDRTPGPPGTHYYRDATAMCYFWNTLDQVLLRPALMDRLEQLAVLDSCDGVSLLSSAHGRPQVSDHLPLFCKLRL